MPEKLVTCAKFKKQLPAIDETSPEGQRAMKMARLFGGAELQQRIRDHVSIDAWRLWPEYMLMVVNEYRLDPSSEQSNRILGEHMQRFFFNDDARVPGYTPPDPE